MKTKFIVLLGLIWFLTNQCRVYSQDSLVTEVNQEQTIEELIDSHLQDIPELNERVTISLSDVSIEEIIRGIAHEANLNVNIKIDPSYKLNVTNNFNNVKARDVIVFLSKEYDLQISFIGNIITISKHKAQKEPEPPKINIYYNEAQNLITLDYQDASLSSVAKEITKITGKNIVLSPGIGSNKVSGYVKDKPFDLAIEKFAFANNLTSKVTDDQFYILKENKIETKQSSSNTYSSKSNMQKIQTIDPDSYELKIDIVQDSISIYAVNAPIMEAVKRVSDKMGINYFVTSPIEGQQTYSSKKLSYEKFLENILNGTEYSFKNTNSIYIIGKNDVNHLKKFKIIQLQHRSVDTLSSIIIDEIKEGTTIKEFPELNSLIVSGPQTQIDQVEAFIHEIDKSVPVILIEVLIVDYVKHHRVETGISMGINNDNTASPVKQVLPSVKYDMNPATVNSLINSFNGFGWFKLGKVPSSFYASIDALESNGIIELKSTPRLSTLNGHEAKLIKGVQTFYKEEQSTLQGAINPYQSNFTRYQPIEANLEIIIKPIVSGDEQITMKITIEQSDFNFKNTEGPPDKETRKFESMIRIKNQEMILLGGLEDMDNVNTGEGVPILSRIPIIKWFFSKKVKEKYHSKLNFFIKPTIIN